MILIVMICIPWSLPENSFTESTASGELGRFSVKRHIGTMLCFAVVLEGGLTMILLLMIWHALVVYHLEWGRWGVLVILRMMILHALMFTI